MTTPSSDSELRALALSSSVIFLYGTIAWLLGTLLPAFPPAFIPRPGSMDTLAATQAVGPYGSRKASFLVPQKPKHKGRRQLHSCDPLCASVFRPLRCPPWGQSPREKHAGARNHTNKGAQAATAVGSDAVAALTSSTEGASKGLPARSTCSSHAPANWEVSTAAMTSVV